MRNESEAWPCSRRRLLTNSQMRPTRNTTSMKDENFHLSDKSRILLMASVTLALTCTARSVQLSKYECLSRARAHLAAPMSSEKKASLASKSSSIIINKLNSPCQRCHARIDLLLVLRPQAAAAAVTRMIELTCGRHYSGDDDDDEENRFPSDDYLTAVRITKTMAQLPTCHRD